MQPIRKFIIYCRISKYSLYYTRTYFDCKYYLKIKKKHSVKDSKRNFNFKVYWGTGSVVSLQHPEEYKLKYEV